MSESGSPYLTTPIEAADAKLGFSCGKHPLDDYFARHAVANDSSGIGRTYVLHRGADDPAELPAVLGFYTLSMASAESPQVSKVLEKKLPKYPMPVALIGRLAVDHRARGRRLGEKLLMDALCRIVHAATLVGCTGVIVDAKDVDAERFYAKYDFGPAIGARPASPLRGATRARRGLWRSTVLPSCSRRVDLDPTRSGITPSQTAGGAPLRVESVVWFAHMKTTVDIAGPVLRRAKRLAAARNTTLKALIESALREELAREAAAPGAVRVHTHTFRGRGLRAGLSRDDWGSIRSLAYDGHGG